MLLDLDIGVIRHHQRQVVLERQLQLSARYEVIQPYGAIQFDLGPGLGKDFAKV